MITNKITTLHERSVVIFFLRLPIFAIQAQTLFAMKNLLIKLMHSDFVLLATRYANTRLGDADHNQLYMAYECFIDHIQRQSGWRGSPKLKALHALARIRERLLHLLEQMPDAESTIPSSLLKSAVTLVDFERRIIYMQLRYPSLADKPLRTVPKSPLYLSRQFTPTDLMELVTALQLSGIIRRIDGSQCDFATLVEQITWVFNVRINNPGQCRHAVVGRKLWLTRFLDFLRNSLIEYSQR